VAKQKSFARMAQMYKRKHKVLTESRTLQNYEIMGEMTLTVI